jgi:hypothetical protein
LAQHDVGVERAAVGRQVRAFFENENPAPGLGEPEGGGCAARA